MILSDFEQKGQGTGTAVPGILRDWSGTGTADPPSLEGLGLQSQAMNKVSLNID